MVDETGNLINPTTLSKKFKKLLKDNEIKEVRFHDLRHTHATNLLKEGIHAKIVSERLGHSSIQITLDTYSHVLPPMQASAMRTYEKSLQGFI